jgi:hypothetical protein
MVNCKSSIPVFRFSAAEYFGEFARLNFPEEWPPERRAQVYAQRDAAKIEGKKDAPSRKTKGNRKKAKGRCKTHPARRKTNELPQRTPRIQSRCNRR